jgi:hypothetical protein
MSVAPVVQHLVFFALVMTWLGGEGILYAFHVQAKRTAYLQRFAHQIDFVAGAPLFFPGSIQAYRDVGRVMREPQADAEAERLRREMWRRYRQFQLWVFGVPVTCIGVAALVIATGFVRLQ